MTDNINIFGQEFPRRELFHYTSLEGLKGVVGGKTLWASNIEFLNDSSEFQHGDRMLQGIIKSRKRSAKGDRREFFNQLEKYPSVFEAEDVFLVSLSEAGDLLSQWRGYTPNAGGFSIGFDPQALSKAALALDQMQLVQCAYGKEEQVELIDRLVDWCVDKWQKREEEQKRATKAREFSFSPLLLFRVYTTFVAASIKHESFSEEREWRLLGVCRDAKKFRFRSGRSTLIPFIELAWGSGTKAQDLQPITSVTVGPCPTPDLSKKSARRLLSSNGAEGTVVKISSIPFRAW